MKKIFTFASLCFLLSACGEKIYDVEYYKTNHEKAEEMLKRCEAGEISGDNCSNARDGLSKYNAKKFMEGLNRKR